MTENEALKLMESLQISHDCEMVKTLDFKATVIKALEDLQQYRAIGTVEEFKTLKDKGIPIIHGKAELELHDKQVRVDAISDLKQRFRNEYEDAEAMEMEDCINWADWLDATAEQIMMERKG